MTQNTRIRNPKIGQWSPSRRSLNQKLQKRLITLSTVHLEWSDDYGLLLCHFIKCVWTGTTAYMYTIIGPTYSCHARSRRYTPFTSTASASISLRVQPVLTTISMIPAAAMAQCRRRRLGPQLAGPSTMFAATARARSMSRGERSPGRGSARWPPPPPSARPPRAAAPRRQPAGYRTARRRQPPPARRHRLSLGRQHRTRQLSPPRVRSHCRFRIEVPNILVNLV